MLKKVHDSVNQDPVHIIVAGKLGDKFLEQCLSCASFLASEYPSLVTYEEKLFFET